MKSVDMFNIQTHSSTIRTFHEIKTHGRSWNGILHKIFGLCKGAKELKELKLILYCVFLVSIKQSLTPARTLHLLENQ